MELLKDYFALIIFAAANLVGLGKLLHKSSSIEKRLSKLEDVEVITSKNCKDRQDVCHDLQGSNFKALQNEMKTFRETFCAKMSDNETQHNIIMEHLLNGKK